jgi:hypothetical protein
MNNVIYSDNIFGKSFNLYSCSEDLDFEATKTNVLDNFIRLYEDAIKKVLLSIGLEYKGLNYFSPKYYNYQGDSIDLTLMVKDKDLFLKAVLDNKDLIDAELKKNKSYDGYMALTVGDSDEEILKIRQESNWSPDVIVLKVLLCDKIDFNVFEMQDYFILEDDAEQEPETRNLIRLNKCIECGKPFEEEDLSGYCFDCCEKVKK